jgi:integrase
LIYKATEHERERSLADDEIRLLWAATAECAVYGKLVRFLLCTGARRDEAAEMPRRELQGDVWVLPAERNKVKKELKRPLSGMAQSILADMPEIEGNPHVFPGKGDGPFNHHSRAKAQLDARLALLVQQETRPADAPVPFAEKFQLHDLRRTARSLLSECGVNADIAELCLGHLKRPIRRVYDRYEFLEEKRDAFERLAAKIRDIVEPPPANVRQLRKAG